VTLILALFEISKNPEVAEKLYLEAIEICGHEEQVTWDHVHNLEFVFESWDLGSARKNDESCAVSCHVLGGRSITHKYCAQRVSKVTLTLTLTLTLTEVRYCFSENEKTEDE
jgi:hypothetical protein